MRYWKFRKAYFLSFVSQGPTRPQSIIKIIHLWNTERDERHISMRIKTPILEKCSSIVFIWPKKKEHLTASQSQCNRSQLDYFFQNDTHVIGPMHMTLWPPKSTKLCSGLRTPPRMRESPWTEPPVVTDGLSDIHRVLGKVLRNKANVTFSNQ